MASVVDKDISARVNTYIMSEDSYDHSVSKKFGHLNRINKFCQLLSELQCSLDACLCKSFKFDESIAKGKNGFNDDEWAKILLNSACQDCKHKGADHGKALDLLNISRDEDKINEKLQLSSDYARLSAYESNESDAFLKSVYANLKQMIHSQLYEYAGEDVYHLPPFEYPSIDYIVYNYICFNFKVLREGSTPLDKIVNFGKLLINKLNTFNLSDLEPFLLSNLSSEDVCYYKTCYELWLVYSLIPRFVNSLKSYPPSQIFGLRFLKIISKIAFDQMLANHNFKKHPAKMEFCKFICQFKKELCKSTFNAHNYIEKGFLEHYNVQIYNSPIECESLLTNGPNSSFIKHKDVILRDFVVHIENCHKVDNLISSSSSCSSGSVCDDESVIENGIKNKANRTSLKRKCNNSTANERVLNLRQRTIVIDSDKEKQELDLSTETEDSLINENTYIQRCTCFLSSESEIYYEHIRDGSKLKKKMTVQSKMKLLLLNELQHLISRQLPKMGSDYIEEVLFDPFHHSIVLVKNRRVIGGIIFLIFKQFKFAEITFCAIKSSEQVKGYGTILMELLKRYCLGENIKYFLTYADEYAVGYFCKQGFTNNITIPKDIYATIIQYYRNAVLMECKLKSTATNTVINEKLHQMKSLSSLVSNSYSNCLFHKPIKKSFSYKAMADLVINFNSNSKYQHLLNYTGSINVEFKNNITLKNIVYRVKMHRYWNARVLYYDVIRALRLYQLVYSKRSKFHKNALFLERKLKKIFKDVFGIEEVI